MAQKIFNKQDFTKTNEKEYQLEYTIGEIGEGVNLIVEKLTEQGKYEVVQAPLRRSDNKIYIVWDSPFDGRVLFDV
ncbi:glutathione synthase [Chryseobacterium gleum]|uniref:glutathione synthase n=1 Tax=Chryseobacterium gleum TaxID=250 RepID=UPI001E3DF2F2|nr:glutathione synthase [Chryseobacterium gleum]MCE4065885.1 glutathione synthase [Chryseobacterium gleum]